MSGTHDRRAATLDAYCRLFEELTPDRLGELRDLCAPDIRFADPFQELAGIDRYVALYAHMFRSVEGPRFVVLDRAIGSGSGMIRWRFSGRVRGRAFAIEGMSEVRFDPAGERIAAHVDHWDASGQVYARLPLIGSAVRALRRLFAAGV